jgi:hypothetical protein
MASVNIRSFYSAQPSSSKPNPFVEQAVQHIIKESLIKKVPHLINVVDQGCGKLRHLPVLAKYFRNIILVDTKDQLNRKQKIFEHDDTTIAEYIHATKQGSVQIMPADHFARTRLALDLIFNICALDVEVPKSRKEMFRAAVQNLKTGGLFVVIVPRNDQTILVRCTPENEHQDGHIFHHHGIVTFYRNFRSQSVITKLGSAIGFSLVADLSVYRQICLIFRRQ